MAIVKRNAKPRSNRQVKPRGSDGRATVVISKQSAEVISNPDSLADWDDEELERGQRKDKNGQFRGRPPTVVPIELHNELTRRLFQKANMLLRSNLISSCNVLIRIMESDFADDSARLKAVDMLMSRVLGKVPDRVELNTNPEEPEWMKALKDATIVGDIIDVPSEEAS